MQSCLSGIWMTGSQSFPVTGHIACGYVEGVDSLDRLMPYTSLMILLSIQYHQSDTMIIQPTQKLPKHPCNVLQVLEKQQLLHCQY